MTNSFDIEVVAFESGGLKALVPLVDGQSLVDLVAAYETERGYEPAGGYAGLVPDYFNFGDLSQHYDARGERQWPKPNHAWVLGCSCGELGCWPLAARVEVTAHVVTWADFSQEHRPNWDYANFGPFIFDRLEYVQAVARAAGAVG